MNSHTNCALHRFACLTAAATYLLIAAGASVTSNRAGLAVPDWPTTYGQFMFSFPYSKWVGNIFWEHGHRLIASTVGILTIILALWLVRCEPRRWVRRLGIGALAAVIAQGILGGLTVQFLLPPAISIAHAALAQAFFCMTVALAVATSPKWREAHPGIETSGAGTMRLLAGATTIAIYVQLILGASVRHSAEGVIAHIIGAVGVTGCIGCLVVFVFRNVPLGEFTVPATILAALVGAQSALGLATLAVYVPKHAPGQLTLVQIVLPTIHLAVGALILVTSLMMTLKSFRHLAATKNSGPVPLVTGAVL